MLNNKNCFFFPSSKSGPFVLSLGKIGLIVASQNNAHTEELNKNLQIRRVKTKSSNNSVKYHLSYCLLVVWKTLEPFSSTTQVFLDFFFLFYKKNQSEQSPYKKDPSRDS